MKQLTLELKKLRLQTFLWAFILTAFVLVGLVEFQVFELSGPAVSEFMEAFPPILKSMFGMNNLNLTEFSGYYSMLAYYLIIMLSVHGLFLGYKLASSEESDKTVDFLLSKPISRTKVLLHKVIAGTVSILVIHFVLVSLQLLTQEHSHIILNASIILLVSHLLLYGIGLLFYFLFGEKGDKIGLLFILIMYLAPIFFELTDRFNIQSLFTWFDHQNLEKLSTSSVLVISSLFLSFVVLVLISLKLFKDKDLIN